MKIQCSCGEKFVFEITPEMKSNPVRFLCPACGADSSEFVDGLIRQELGQSETPPGRVIAVKAVSMTAAVGREKAGGPVRIQLPTAPTAAPVEQPRAPVRLSVQGTGNRPSAPVEKPAAEPEGPRLCLKHPGEEANETCRVCSKPICPKCMELFGYVCSPLCKARAASSGIDVPVYAGQRSVAEARRWRQLAWATGSAAAVALALLGFWFWYAWIGSRPKVIFAAHFDQPAASGRSALAGKEQLVLLHGSTLMRYDLKLKKQVWSQYVVDKSGFPQEINREMEAAKALIYKANNEAWEHVPAMPDPEKLRDELERSAAAALDLRVHGQNIWLLSGSKLTRYDWDTGKPTQEIQFPPNYGALVARGDELMVMNDERGKPIVTSVNLNTCDSRKLEAFVPDLPAPAPPAVTNQQTRKPKAGLPIGMPGRDAGKPMDPAKVAQQAQNLTLPARIALPAVLANSWSQERALSELNDANPNRTAAAATTTPRFEHVKLLPAKDGFIEFSSQLVEEKVVSRQAMSASPGSKSVLEGPVNVTQSAEVANEILNEMQRARGGDVIEEDLSRYLVKLRQPGRKEDWTGEVIGAPSIFSLESVNVIAANKTLLVFDKANKKLWQTNLLFNIEGESSDDSEPGPGSNGEGPCVERFGTLFVFDHGVLNAFDLKSGEARWRLPSVGITGMFFDDQGMMYVNTSSANPQTLNQPRQINISQRIVPEVLKVDGRTGKILWRAHPGGMVHYVSGKFVYVIKSFAPAEDENPYLPETGFEMRAHVRIKRINPKNGHDAWEHFQQRAPLQVQFDRNVMLLVFKKEVQVLRSWTW